MQLIRFATALFCLTALFACSEWELTKESAETDPIAVGEAAENSPRLYVFDCGRLDYTDITLFGISNRDTPVREHFVPCYMVEHKGKRMLWDAGLPLSAAGKGEIVLMKEGNAQVSMTYTSSLLDQLSNMHLTPEHFDYLALSHIHFDHAGAANAFKTAIWIIQEVEHTAAFAVGDDDPVFDKSLYRELADSETRLINGDHDIFGDGAVKIIFAPGHTPGHQLLLVNLKKTGPIVLSGDLYHFRVTRTLKATPLYNTDRQETVRSMEKVEQLLVDTGATLWIGHDMALAKTLNLAPAYYD